MLNEKARAVYENLIDLASDPDVIEPLLFLRQREVVHYQRFKELYERYAKMLNKKASCLMSVVDSKYIEKIATPEERQTGLNNMIILALESAIKM